MPRHVARLVVNYFFYVVCLTLARLVARLVVDYFAYAVRLALARLIVQLVVDYFTYAARPGDSARRAARLRLLRLHRASGCLGTSRGSLSATLPMPHVRVPRHVARLVAQFVAWLLVDYFASCRLVVDYFAYATRPGASARCVAHHRLFHLRGAPRRVISPLDFSSVGCTGSHRALGHSVSRLDYSVRGRRDFVLRPHWLYFSHAVHRDYLSRGNTDST
jgi:hypothetical protein